MKKKFIVLSMASIIFSTTFIGFTPVISSIENQNTIEQLNPNLIKKYAEQTAMVPKSLLISKEKSYTTSNLLNDIASQQSVSSLNLPSANADSLQFIKNLTTRLDYASMAQVQANFISAGENQNEINQKKAEINEIQTIQNTISSNNINKYFNNQMLSQPAVIKIADGVLRSLRTSSPQIADYLKFSKYYPIIEMVMKELTTDWDQQSAWGKSPLEAMENYMNSPKTIGQFSEDKTKNNGNWYYVKLRAKNNNWNWNDFYQYIAGVNFNYMIKTLSGEYLGGIISNGISIKGINNASFDKEKIFEKITNALKKLPSTPDAWPLLVNAIVPVLKTIPNFLNLTEQTKAITALSWNRFETSENVLYIQEVLYNILSFFDGTQPEQLENLIINLLTGKLKFAEDIIIRVYYWGLSWGDTLPGIISTASWLTKSLKPEEIGRQIANTIKEQIDKIKLTNVLQNINDFGNKYITRNSTIDLIALVKQINTIINKDLFDGLTKLIDIIENPKTLQSAKDVLEILGVDLSKKIEFKPNSVLSNLKKALNQTGSPIYEIINLVTNQDRNGIVDNMLAEAKKDYDNYLNLFDLKNEINFNISNIKFIQQSFNGKYHYNLSYELSKPKTKEKYQLSFITYQLQKPIFLMSQFHQIRN